jgi:anti-sigma factor RsiW
MTACAECQYQIDYYLDKELHCDEVVLFNRHIEECRVCREILWERRLLAEEIRLSVPLYVAPDELRQKVLKLINEAASEAPAAPDAGGRAEKSTRAKRLSPIGAGLAILVGIAILWICSARRADANAFIDAAVAARQHRPDGSAPSEIKTDSAAKISQWFAGRLPFDFRLPAEPHSVPQTPPCHLIGGRTVRFGNIDAAYVAYLMQDQEVDLMVMPVRAEDDANRISAAIEGKTFHSYLRDGLRIVTWSVNHLTYALVSSANMPVGQTCLVCDRLRGQKTGRTHY